MPPASRKPILTELAGLFLRLGCTAFGGPAAHIAMMEDEVVRRRQWLSHQEFLDLLGATNLIPGPNSTEMAIHIGHRRGGWPGLTVAGLCFILPAALIVTVIAWAYVKYGALPQVSGILYGVKPVVVVLVLQALWRLGQSALKNRWLSCACAACILLNLFGVNELVVLFGAGFIFAALKIFSMPRKSVSGTTSIFAFSAPILPVLGPAAASTFTMPALFFFFLKVGSVLFGSGYVLLAFLRADLVERWEWLTESQLLDAIAVGQITPGPVFTTATFIGYLLGGGTGACVATAGIFLPAFFFVALSAPFIPRLRQSLVAGAFLDGLNAASLALMAVVTFQLSFTAVIDLFTIFLAVAAAVLLFRFKLNSAWLLPGGALLGLLKTLLAG